VEVRVGQKKLMGRVRITPEAMYDTSKGEYAWKQARKDEMDGLIKDLARREEYVADPRRPWRHRVRQRHGNELDHADARLAGRHRQRNFGNRFVMVGMYVADVNPATGQLRLVDCEGYVRCRRTARS
jgi:crotonobetainyl-CoA:carnitine CoA-transferase CaiB-like acyl-CoA transferase